MRHLGKPVSPRRVPPLSKLKPGGAHTKGRLISGKLQESLRTPERMQSGDKTWRPSRHSGPSTVPTKAQACREPLGRRGAEAQKLLRLGLFASDAQEPQAPFGGGHRASPCVQTTEKRNCSTSHNTFRGKPEIPRDSERTSITPFDR